MALAFTLRGLWVRLVLHGALTCGDLFMQNLEWQAAEVGFYFAGFFVMICFIEGSQILCLFLNLISSNIIAEGCKIV